MDKRDLLKLIDDDDLGLLDLDRKPILTTPDDRLLESFLEINEFYLENKREPASGADIHEHKLASRLKHIRESVQYIEYLKASDTFNLLSGKNKKIETLDEIFSDDSLDLLSHDDTSVFDIKNVPDIRQRLVEMVAKRRVCKEFKKYEPRFNELHVQLKNSEKILDSFVTSEQIREGVFFVVGGILGLVVEMPELKKDAYRTFDGRLYCVFENGTESNLLFRSLVKLMQADSGSRIIADKVIDLFNDEDKESGYIYVLKSLSNDPQIAATKNLYKIGFSTTEVEERIKNAEKDPTYLMSPVSVVASYKCFNMNPQRFERLIHRFFGNSCLDLEIIDNHGNRYTPREWFIAPIHVIAKVVDLIVRGEIVNFIYDRDTESLIKIK